MKKSVKSVLSLIMATLLISTMAIMPANAENDIEVISSLEFSNGYIPSVGTPVTIPDIKVSDSRCKIVESSVEWRFSEDGTEWNTCYDSLHVYDYSYALYFEVEATDAKFADKVSATLDGVEVEFVLSDAIHGSVTVVYDKEVLEKIVVQNAPAPVIGESTTTENMVFLGNGTDDIFSVEMCVLMEKDPTTGEYAQSGDEEFVEGKEYAYEVALLYNGNLGYTGFAYSSNPKIEPNYGNAFDVTNGVEHISFVLEIGKAIDELIIDTDTSSDDTNNDDTNSDDTNTDDTNSDDTNSDDTNTDDTNSDNTDTDSSSDTDDGIPGKPLYGDVNCDGKVDMEDVTSLQKIIAKLSTHDSFGKMSMINSDCDHNDKIDMVDVTMIQKFLAKLIPDLDPKA